MTGRLFRRGEVSSDDELTPSRLLPSFRFTLQKGTESSALTNCITVNEGDLGGAQFVRVNRRFLLGVK